MEGTPFFLRFSPIPYHTVYVSSFLISRTLNFFLFWVFLKKKKSSWLDGTRNLLYSIQCPDTVFPCPPFHVNLHIPPFLISPKVPTQLPLYRSIHLLYDGKQQHFRTHPLHLPICIGRDCPSLPSMYLKVSHFLSSNLVIP